jgi:hypothetical protein
MPLSWLLKLTVTATPAGTVMVVMLKAMFCATRFTVAVFADVGVDVVAVVGVEVGVEEGVVEAALQAGNPASASKTSTTGIK